MTRLTTAQARRLGILPGKRSKPVAYMPKNMPRWDARTIPGGVWLQIPEVPPSLNVWKNWHWAKQARYKKGLIEAVRCLAMALKLPRHKRALVQVIHYFGTTRHRDADNMAPKFLLDALVQGGLLVDDRAEWIELPEPGLEIDPGRPRTEVFIWGRD